MTRKVLLICLCIGSSLAGGQEKEPRVYTAFGDSITAGVGASVGYPPRLEAMLTAERGASRVINRGRPGETTAQGLSRLPGVLAQDRPHVLLLMEGTNDVTEGVSQSATIGNLEAMVSLARDAGVRVIIATLPPRADGRRNASQSVSAGITAMAGRTGVTLVDMEAAVSQSNLVDHVHFNDAGYQEMAAAWFGRIGGGGGGGGGGMCFVATAVYGDPEAGEVRRLRRFRDLYMMPTRQGRFLVGSYYALGPDAAGVVKKSPRLQEAVREGLDAFGSWIEPLPGIGAAH